MIPKVHSGNTIFNILYFSDVHGKTANVRHFKTAVDVFDRRFRGQSNLKVAGGDLNMDTETKPNILLLKLMDLIGLDASSVGNHDLEGGNFWSEVIEKAKPKFRFLSANLNFLRPSKLQEQIAKSTIIERNGERIGIVGVSPIDYGTLSHITSFNDFVKVANLDDTINAVRGEVQVLERQGIDKVMLLAHTGRTSMDGEKYYERLANIGGVDIIVGGHDHLEFDRWLVSERGEPVKVVSVGKAQGKDIVGEDLDSFGVLQAFFDKNGVLIPERCRNEVERTQNYPSSVKVAKMEEKYLQTSKIISSSVSELSCKNRLAEENPVGSLAADASLWIVNKETRGEKAQISFVNSGTVRGILPKGSITMGDLRQALPYVSERIIKTKLNKRQIIDTLNWCAESTTLPKVAPGVMQVGGMRYTIGKDNKVKDVYLLAKDGSLGERIDIQPDDKEYTVVYDDYLMTGVAGLIDLKKDPKALEIEYYPYSRQSAVIEYLKHNFRNKPVEVRTGRIEIEAKDIKAKEKELVAAR